MAEEVLERKRVLICPQIALHIHTCIIHTNITNTYTYIFTQDNVEPLDTQKNPGSDV